MVMAFAKSIQFSTSNSCELKASLHGIEWCHDNSNFYIILEMDSLMIVNMIKGLTPPPWTLRKTVSKIQRKIQDMNCEIIHYCRDANGIAGALARYTTIRDMDYIFSKKEDMPDSRPMSMDKLNLASFRFKREKHS